MCSKSIITNNSVLAITRSFQPLVKEMKQMMFLRILKYSTIISFILGISPKISADDLNKVDFAKWYIEKVSFIGDNNEKVEMYAVSGITSESNFFNRTFTNYDALQDYSVRTESYKRVMRDIVLQKDFDMTAMMDEINGESNRMSPNEVIGWYKDIVTTSELGVVLADYISGISKLNAVKNKDEYKILLDKLKNTGHMGSSTNHFGEALTAVSIATNVANIFNTYVIISDGVMMINAAQIDKGLKTLLHLKELNIIQDQAYLDALEATIEEFQNLPVNFWTKLAISIRDNKDALRNGAISISELATDISLLINYSPIGAWIKAGLFTYNTWSMIQDWQDNLRDATSMATIYGYLKEVSFTPSTHIGIDFYDYVQYAFLNNMTTVLSNSYLKVWEVIKPGQKDVRIEFTDETEKVKSHIVLRRLTRFMETFKDAEPGSIKDIFIAFILDSSSSMTSSDPKDIRKSAVKQIINLLKGNELVFVVDFDHEAKWLNDKNWDNWDAGILYSLVDLVDSDGNTNLGIGLDKMKEALEGRIPDGAYGGVLMFTDGKGSYNNEAAWFQQHNIPVHTISYTKDADASTMNKISSMTGGVFLMARNEQDVISALSDYFNTIVNYNKICAFNGNIVQGQSLAYTFIMDYYTEEAVFNNTWNGSKIRLTLTAPDGTIYAENQLGEWFLGNNYTSVKIKDPLGGKWTAVLEGVDIPQGGEPFRFEVSGDTPSKFEVKSKVLSSGQVSVNLEEKNNSIALDSLKPKILVETPKDRKIDISNNYSNGTFTFLARDGEGAYNVSIEFITNDKQGNTIQRTFKRSVMIGDDVPSFVANVQEVLGNIIVAPLGRSVGNQEGIKCYIYPGSGPVKEAIAIGIVTFITENECQIDIKEFLTGNAKVQVGDIVQLDYLQWQNDNP
ncbi:MAG: VWA domain-containing protein [Bacteroidetes bacterium]|nr:VWA domain-containing protein [Bacteroidota bacterium]